MRAMLLTFLLCAAGLAPLALAQSPSVSCGNAQFSAAVLERFPRVREACLDVISRDTQYFAVFKAKLVGVSHTGVRIRPKLPDGSLAEARQVKVHEDRRVLVDGRPVTFDELSLGQELTVYIEVLEPLVVFPPAVSTEAWQPAPLEEITPSPTLVRMPSTASLVGWLGFLAAALLGFAAVFPRQPRC